MRHPKGSVVLYLQDLCIIIAKSLFTRVAMLSSMCSVVKNAMLLYDARIEIKDGVGTLRYVKSNTIPLKPRQIQHAGLAASPAEGGPFAHELVCNHQIY